MIESSKSSDTEAGAAVPIKASSIDALVDAIETMQRSIMARAYEIFCSRGEQFANQVDDWVRAERDLLRRPPIELSELDGKLELTVDVAGLAPEEIDLQVSPERVLVESIGDSTHAACSGNALLCEFQTGKLHRAVDLPRAVDPKKVTAHCRHGLLHVSLPLAAEKVKVEKVKVEKVENVEKIEKKVEVEKAEKVEKVAKEKKPRTKRVPVVE